jgi:hypothetical protein
MDEAHTTFKGLKCYLTSPPVLVALDPGEPLLLYTITTTEVISMVDPPQDGSRELALGPVTDFCAVQRLVYFLRKVLHEAKTRYPVLQKLLYAVLTTLTKLCHYFQAHKVSVLTSYPLRSILHNLDAMGKFTKWAVELAEFDLEFAP